MSPRPYHSDRRDAAANRTRERIVAAARELLIAEEGFAGFTMDAVARHAAVSRMTVYHQFASKAGLLDGLLDRVAAAGQLSGIAEAFALPEPLEVLDRLIFVFTRFWASEPLLFRRLIAAEVVDPDIREGLERRGELRRQIMRALVAKLELAYGALALSDRDAVDILHALTSFGTYGMLSPSRSQPEIVALLCNVARRAMGLPGEGPDTGLPAPRNRRRKTAEPS